MNTLLYSSFDGNAATKHGHAMEPELEKWLEKDMKTMTVTHKGLVAHNEFKFLAGSPDGIGEANGEKFLIEYKAPYTLFINEVPIEKAILDRTFFLEKKKEQLSLKKSHDYFYQIQGLLEVCDLPYCLLVVGAFESAVRVRVERERDFFKSMLPKLRLFYFGAVLPERAYAMKRRGGLRKEVLDLGLVSD